MRKTAAVLLIIAMVITAVSCSGGTGDAEAESPGEESESAEASPAPAGDGSELIVYFSATGNTKTVAENLAEIRGCDIVEIEPAVPYTEEDLDYSNDSCRANLEQNDDSARPEIANTIENIDSYDVIYLGFPIWWGDMPKIMCTFLDTYDLSGKTIAPFCTSGGSGISSAADRIAEMEPDAEVTEGLRTSTSSAEADLTDWLGEIGL